MIRLVIGLVLMPTAALTLVAAGRSAGLAALHAPSADPFLIGAALAAASWLAGRYVAEPSSPLGFFDGALRQIYVFGHELTHAIAAWASGASVRGLHVGETGGHVDLSHSNAFIALAPYCLPFYSLLVIAGYRVFLWVRPGQGHSVFFALMGLTLSFHALKTFEVLWDRRQPDLAAAGGVVFSLSWIGFANGLVLLVLLKALFPATVTLGPQLHRVASLTGSFWRASWRFVRPLSSSFVAQMRRP